MNYAILLMLFLVGGYDIYLSIKDHPTLSQQCQALFPPVVDWCIAIGGWIGLCFVKRYFGELDFTLAVFISGFWGHIWMPTKERYKKS